MKGQAAMRLHSLFGIVCVATFASAGDGQKPAGDLPARVEVIFAAKCSECHGRALQRPKAGVVLDPLGAVAGRRDWVVPGEPERSYLWELIRDGDMPAKGAKGGPLTAAEKEAVRVWITAGAPVR
jgi:mono/diheme cytochrome c family protein